MIIIIYRFKNFVMKTVLVLLLLCGLVFSQGNTGRSTYGTQVLIKAMIKQTTKMKNGNQTKKDKRKRKKINK